MPDLRNHSLGSWWPQQSPIDLRNTLYCPELPTLKIKYPKVLHGTVEEHNLLIHQPTTACVQYHGQNCPLLKLHFHTPSEHLIDGTPALFEVHFVHKIPAFVESHSSAYLVLGVLMEARRPAASAAARGPVEQFSLNRMLAEKWTEPGENGMACIRTAGLLPPPAQCGDYYRYEGSLTTPPYDELVSWVVLRNRGSLDHPHEVQLENETHHDARPIQPLARRFVLRNFAR
jgi:carbonic anhydrase